jgi:hypothetical protein
VRIATEAICCVEKIYRMLNSGSLNQPKPKTADPRSCKARLSRERANTKTIEKLAACSDKQRGDPRRSSCPNGDLSAKPSAAQRAPGGIKVCSQRKQRAARSADLNLSLLLAIAAYQRAPTLEARQAVLSVIEARPHLAKYFYGHGQRIHRLTVRLEQQVAGFGCRRRKRDCLGHGYRQRNVSQKS